jgi:hypothetical protein
MKVIIAWWDLDDSDQTIDSLRVYMQEEGVRPWTGVHGLRLKFWISDRVTNRWGAVMLWESTADLTQPRPPHRAAELIGYPPTHRMTVDVEATVEGIHAGQPLSDLGLASEPTGQTVRGIR